MDRFPNGTHNSHEGGAGDSDDAEARRAQFLDKLSKRDSKEHNLFSGETDEDDDEDEEKEPKDSDNKKDNKKTKKLGSFFSSLSDKEVDHDKKPSTFESLFGAAKEKKSKSEAGEEVETGVNANSDNQTQQIEQSEPASSEEASPEATSEMREEPKAESLDIVTEPEGEFVTNQNAEKPTLVSEDETEIIVEVAPSSVPNSKSEVGPVHTSELDMGDAMDHTEETPETISPDVAEEESISEEIESVRDDGGEHPPEPPEGLSAELSPEPPEEDPVSTSVERDADATYAERGFAESMSVSTPERSGPKETERTVIERRGVGPVDLLEWYAIHRVHNKVKKQAKDIEDIRRKAGVEEQEVADLKREFSTDKQAKSEKLGNVEVELKSQADGGAESINQKISQSLKSEVVKVSKSAEQELESVHQQERAFERTAAENNKIQTTEQDFEKQLKYSKTVEAKSLNDRKYNQTKKLDTLKNPIEIVGVTPDAAALKPRVEKLEQDAKIELEAKQLERMIHDQKEFEKFQIKNENFRETDYDLKREIKDDSAVSIGTVLASGGAAKDFQANASIVVDEQTSRSQSSVLEATKWMIEEESDKIKQQRRYKQAIIGGSVTAVVLVAIYLIARLLI